MFLREFFQVRTARHAAIFIHDLDDCGRWHVARHACQITAGFGVTGATQHATRLRHDRKNMTWLHDIARHRITSDGNLNGAGAIGGRNTGGYSGGRFDGNSKIGGIGCVVLIHHQRQLQKFTTIPGKRQADQAARIGRHEIYVFCAHALGGNDQIAFVFAVFIIHQYHHLALANIVDDFFYRIQFHSSLCLYL